MLWLSKHSRCLLTFTLFLTVRPDPPVSLNWTLLNISPSGLSYDVMVSWESPPSADVAAGWMRLEYEIQYRERNAINWEAVSLLFFTWHLYAHTNTHEKMHLEPTPYKNTFAPLHKLNNPEPSLK